MEAIAVDKSQFSEEDNQVHYTKNSREISSNPGGKKGKVLQRSYVLNDLAALKKKLGHEKRKHEFSFSKEAKDGSNAIVQMKASFFEYTKAKFIEEILQSDKIKKCGECRRCKSLHRLFW